MGTADKVTARTALAREALAAIPDALRTMAEGLTALASCVEDIAASEQVEPATPQTVEQWKWRAWDAGTGTGKHTRGWCLVFDGEPRLTDGIWGGQDIKYERRPDLDDVAKAGTCERVEPARGGARCAAAYDGERGFKSANGVRCVKADGHEAAHLADAPYGTVQWPQAEPATAPAPAGPYRVLGDTVEGPRMIFKLSDLEEPSLENLAYWLNIAHAAGKAAVREGQ